LVQISVIESARSRSRRAARRCPFSQRLTARRLSRHFLIRRQDLLSPKRALRKSHDRVAHEALLTNGGSRASFFVKLQESEDAPDGRRTFHAMDEVSGAARGARTPGNLPLSSERVSSSHRISKTRTAIAESREICRMRGRLCRQSHATARRKRRWRSAHL